MKNNILFWASFSLMLIGAFSVVIFSSLLFGGILFSAGFVGSLVGILTFKF